MGALTTSTVVPPAVATFFDRLLLRRALPMLVHMKVAQRRSLSQRNGDTIKFRKFPALSLALTPLNEGVTPSGKQLTFSDITATIRQWGDYVPLSDFVQMVVESPLLRETNKLLAEQSAQTLDALMRDVAAAGSSVFFGGGVSLRSSLTGEAHKVSAELLDRIIRQLDSQNAKRFTRMISASTKVSTFPIRPAYWAITDQDVKFTLENIPGWTPVTNYSGEQQVMEAEIGAYKDLRFLMTTQAKTYLGGGGSLGGGEDVKSTGGNVDVHTILVFGQDAIASVPLEGKSLENIIHPLGSGGISDPLNQRGTSGWKHTGARTRLDETFMTRAEVTVALNNP